MFSFTSKNTGVNNYSVKQFDLNIEKILENWDVHQAVREIIANALDEQQITNTKDIQIFKKDGSWHIRDFGRGINYHHLTQNENKEKTNSDKLIGRFGFGLKDALATLYRNNVSVKIVSKYGVITLNELSKTGFDDVKTLHAQISMTADSTMVGTEFVLNGCRDDDIYKAQALFLYFNNESVLEDTVYGQIIENNDDIANIYINGLKVAEEPNFLFSYNITSLNRQLVKALNRERTNVGRSAYTERIKSILLSCKDNDVIELLIEDLQNISSGDNHDELSWNDVSMYISQQANIQDEEITFVSSDEILDKPDLVDLIEMEGYKPVILPTKLIDKIDKYNENNVEELKINTISKFNEDRKNDKNIIPLSKEDLSEQELQIAYLTKKILSLIGGRPQNVKKIIISEHIYQSELFSETVGLWEPQNNRIVIKRSQLESLSKYAGTLLHECIHALTGADDISRKFEIALTNVIGDIAEQYISNK